MTTRKEWIKHQTKLIYSAGDALGDMLESPDAPVDLSDYPVGALNILKKSCNVSLLFSGDSVFGMITVPEDA